MNEVSPKPPPGRRKPAAAKTRSDPSQIASGPHNSSSPAEARVHRPRSLAAEVGIIVLGVLLALFAQQAAQWFDWRAQAADARYNLKRDEVRLVRWAAERDALSPCIDRRLKELTAIVTAAAASGELPPLGATAMPPRRPWTLRGWETMTSGELLSHMPKDEVRVISSLALYLETVRPMRDQEIALWGRLRALGSRGRPFGQAEAGNMWAALSEAHDHAVFMRQNAIDVAVIARDTGILTRGNVETAWRDGYARGLRAEICQPLGAPGSEPPTQGRNLMEPARPPWTLPAFR